MVLTGCGQRRAAFTMKSTAMYSGSATHSQGLKACCSRPDSCRMAIVSLTEEDKNVLDEPCKVNGKTGHCVNQVVLNKVACVCEPNKIQQMI